MQNRNQNNCKQLRFGPVVWLILLGLGAYVHFSPFNDRPDGQTLIKRSQVLNQMRDWQLAAIEYSESHDGLFPKSAMDLRGYFHKPEPINPFTKEPQWPTDGRIKSLSEARERTGEFVGIGVVEYSVILDSKGRPTSFGIRGGDKDGKVLLGPAGKTTFVFSN